MEEVKSFRKSFVLISVFYVIAGIVLLFWPSMSIDLFCTALGIALLVIGAAHIIIYFTREHMMSIMTMDLSIGVISVAFGAFLLLHPEFVETAMPFAIGVLLMMGAIMKLQNAIDLKRMKFRFWKAILFCSLLLMIAGGVLIYNPFRGQILVIFIGISMIADGTVNIIAMLIIAQIMKKMGRRRGHGPHGSENRPNVIDMDDIPKRDEEQRPVNVNELEIKE